MELRQNAKCQGHIQAELKVGPHTVHGVSSRVVGFAPNNYQPKDLAIYLDYRSWGSLRGVEPVQSDLAKSKVSEVEDSSGKIIYVAWPDWGTIEQDLFKWLINIAMQALNRGKSVEIGCIGSHGRTGTLLAGIVASIEDLRPKESIAKVRLEYCKRAIETKGQEKMIYDLAGNKFS